MGQIMRATQIKRRHSAAASMITRRRWLWRPQGFRKPVESADPRHATLAVQSDVSPSTHTMAKKFFSGKTNRVQFIA